MTTSYDIDPNTQTVAAAWASSPLGQPDHSVGFDFTGATERIAEPGDTTAGQRRPVAKHVIVALALAGIAAGAAVGLMFVGVIPDQPTVVVPATTSAAMPTGCTTSASACSLIVTAPRTAYRTCSASPRRRCRSCATRTSCGRGCIRSRATRRCVEFATAAAKRRPTTCPTRRRPTPAPTRWSHAWSWPI